MRYLTKTPVPTFSSSPSAFSTLTLWQLLPHLGLFDSDTFRCTHPYGLTTGDHSESMLMQKSPLGPSCKCCTHHMRYLPCTPSGSIVKPETDGSLAGSGFSLCESDFRNLEVDFRDLTSDSLQC